MAGTDSQGTVNYRVVLASPGAHLVEVIARVTPPADGPLRFSLPAWIPGSYMIRDFARHVVSVTASNNKKELAVRKIDKSTWEVDANAGPVEVRSKVYAFDLSVRGCYFDTRFAILNGACIFFRFEHAESSGVSVDLLTPDDGHLANWQVATSMQRLTGENTDFGAFAATDYDDLIDHPFLLGDLAVAEFTAGGVSHHVAIAGRHAADLDRLAGDLPLVCQSHIDLFEGPPPIDRYWFLVVPTAGSYGGLEHCHSSLLMCARDELPAAGDTGVSKGYRRFLGLVSHEYYHLWNVKRIRPAELVRGNLAKEQYTRQLWLFEGITSYYDDLALLRAGLIGEESYLELIGQNLTRIYRTPGRRHQTLEESSFDAWTRFYKQDENSPNAIVSYYAKGAMVALALDLEIRVRTDNRLSLDDVMRTLWRRYGVDSKSGVPHGSFEELTEDVTGLDLGAFFRQNLRGTVDPPVGILLAQFGVRLQMRPTESESDPGGKPGSGSPETAGWLGLRTRVRGAAVEVATVLEGSPAQDAGICPGDELVAVDGLRVSAESAAKRLTACAPEATASIAVFRGDELLEFAAVATEPPRDTCFLEIEEDARQDCLERRTRWWHEAQ